MKRTHWLAAEVIAVLCVATAGCLTLASDIFVAACVLNVHLDDAVHGVQVVEPRFAFGFLRARSVPPYRELYAAPSHDIGMTMSFKDDPPYYFRDPPNAIRMSRYRRAGWSKSS